MQRGGRDLFCLGGAHRAAAPSSELSDSEEREANPHAARGVIWCRAVLQCELLGWGNLERTKGVEPRSETDAVTARTLTAQI